MGNSCVRNSCALESEQDRRRHGAYACLSGNVRVRIGTGSLTGMQGRCRCSMECLHQLSCWYRRHKQKDRRNVLYQSNSVNRIIKGLEGWFPVKEPQSLLACKGAEVNEVSACFCMAQGWLRLSAYKRSLVFLLDVHEILLHPGCTATQFLFQVLSDIPYFSYDRIVCHVMSSRSSSGVQTLGDLISKSKSTFSRTLFTLAFTIYTVSFMS